MRFCPLNTHANITTPHNHHRTPPPTTTNPHRQLEFAAQICCFGPRWCRVPTNVLDAVVVSLSLALEIALRRSDLKDVVGLLIVFRLWRIARIMHATEEILHIEHGKKLHEAEAEAREARAEADAVKAELEAARAALLELQAARALLQQQPQQG